jgi:uncharacterized protein (DUF1778 family)
MPRQPARTTRLEARIAPEILAVVKRAAEIQGRSVSDFVVTAVYDAAQRTVAETDVIRLSVAGQRAFAEALLDPPGPSAGLRQAFESHRRLIREAR